MSLSYEQSPLFQALPVRHAFFTRQGGVSVGDYDSLNGNVGGADVAESVAENHRRISRTMGVMPEALLICRQVHGTTVVTVTEQWSDVWRNGLRPEADAMVTCLPDVALAILTADCVPVLFADAGVGVIGACHAGWRGALAGIVAQTVAAMERLGARRDRIVTALGAAIAQESYEVDADFREQFLVHGCQSADLFQVVPDKTNRFLFDLPNFVLRKVTDAGVGAVSPSFADTYRDEARFFSWRRACHRAGEGRTPRTGGMVSAICR